MPRPTFLVPLLTLFVVGPLPLPQATAAPQPPPAPPRRGPEQFRRMSTAAETAGLAEPFKGITANGEIEPGLYAIRSTGVSTGPVREAATAFLASLTAEQRAKTL